MTGLSAESNNYQQFAQFQVAPEYSKPETSAPAREYAAPVEFHGHAIAQLPSVGHPISSLYSKIISADQNEYSTHFSISELNRESYSNIGADKANSIALDKIVVHVDNHPDIGPQETIYADPPNMTPAQSNDLKSSMLRNQLLQATGYANVPPRTQATEYANVSPRTNATEYANVTTEYANVPTQYETPPTQYANVKPSVADTTAKTDLAFQRVKFEQAPSGAAITTVKKYEAAGIIGSGCFKTAHLVKNLAKEGLFKVITIATSMPQSAQDIKDNANEQKVNDRLYQMKKGKQHNFQHIMTASKVTVEGNDQAVGYKSQYANGGTLDSRLGKLSKGQKLQMSKFLTAGMQEMHSIHLLHRDVKADNVVAFVNDKGEIENLKYIDMGKATFNDTPNPTEYDNTQSDALFLPLRPPEYYPTDGSKPVYTEKSDIYQLGFALWQVHCEIPSHNWREGMNGNMDPAGWKGMDTLNPTLNLVLRDTIVRMRDPNPDNRPSLDEVTAVLNSLENA